MRRRRNDNYSVHRFFCINCGNEGIPLARSISLIKSAEHRKKLYCIYCKCYVNHIECRNETEIELFKENFKNGVFKEEANESIEKSNRIVSVRMPGER